MRKAAFSGARAWGKSSSRAGLYEKAWALSLPSLACRRHGNRQMQCRHYYLLGHDGRFAGRLPSPSLQGDPELPAEAGHPFPPVQKQHSGEERRAGRENTNKPQATPLPGHPRKKERHTFWGEAVCPVKPGDVSMSWNLTQGCPTETISV